MIINDKLHSRPEFGEHERKRLASLAVDYLLNDISAVRRIEAETRLACDQEFAKLVLTLEAEWLK